MLRKIVGKECTNPECSEKNELVASGEMCEKCMLPLTAVKVWNRGGIAAVSLLVLGGCASALYFHRSGSLPLPAAPPPEFTAPAPAPREISLSYSFEMPDGQETSLVPPDRTFRSGERFRVALKPDFNAYVYLFNQNPRDPRVQVLYPVAAKTAELPTGTETKAPGDGAWFRMDRKPGSEVLILVASPTPLPELNWTGGTLDRQVFESWLAKTEQDAKPKSQRIFQDATWTNLMAASSQNPLVFVHRIPLKHE